MSKERIDKIEGRLDRIENMLTTLLQKIDIQVSKQQPTNIIEEKEVKKIGIDYQIPSYETVRDIVNETNDDYQDYMRVCYLFSLQPAEICGKYTIMSDDVSVIAIDDEKALKMNISTVRLGRQVREVVVPLSKIEPWAKIILDLSEDRSRLSLFPRIHVKTLQNHVKKCFKSYGWPTYGYFRRKKERYNKPHITTFTASNLREIRQWELACCNKFNEYDIRNYIGKNIPSDYQEYFKKLLKKSGKHKNVDVIKSIKLKRLMFNPRDKYRYYFQEYLDVNKLLQEGKIRLDESELKVDTYEYPAPPMGDALQHRLLKSNIKKWLEKRGKSLITLELSNIDVYAEDLHIAIECGHTRAKTLLDCVYNRYKEFRDTREFWIVDFFDVNQISTLTKFYIEQSK